MTRISEGTWGGGNSLRISCSTTELCRLNDLRCHQPPQTAPPVTTASPRERASSRGCGERKHDIETPAAQLDRGGLRVPTAPLHRSARALFEAWL